MLQRVKRGLNRLFIVCTVCWLAFAAVVLWEPWHIAIESHRQYAAYVKTLPPLPPGFKLDSPKYAESSDYFATLAMKMGGVPADGPPPLIRWPTTETLFVAAVPFAVYAFGFAVLWAISGFGQVADKYD